MNCSIQIEKQISIMVPVYNEEKILSANYSYWYQLSQVTELIFVDGGSTDRSVELAAKLGLKKPYREIFINIDWSSNRVLNQTVCKINKMHLKAAFIPRWYDVDDQDGLNILIKDLKGKQDKSIARWTRKYLEI